MKTSFKGLLPLLLLLTLPAAVEAQFTFTTNNGAITITKYTGGGGAVTIPNLTNGLPVTGIGTNAFFQSTNVTSVTIGTNVSSIGDWAFYGCASLANVTMPNSVTSIGDDAFSDCKSLTSVTIPNSVTSIGNYAFFSCLGLTDVTIGTGVTSIGGYAFSSCIYLSGVYFAGNAPGTGLNVFAGNLFTTVYYLPGTTGWGTTFAGRSTALWRPRVKTSDASFGVRTNQFGFNITWASGKVVVIEASTNVANPSWSPVGTNTLTGGSSYFSDPQWSSHTRRFYRLRWP